MKTFILSSTFAMGLVAFGASMAPAQVGPRGDIRPDFGQVDANGDGVLTLAEFQTQGQAKFSETDANGDGMLSVDELLASAAQQRALMIDRLIQEKDANGDGMLSLEEMSPRNPARFFDKADSDGNGEISRAEWDAARPRGRT